MIYHGVLCATFALKTENYWNVGIIFVSLKDYLAQLEPPRFSEEVTNSKSSTRMSVNEGLSLMLRRNLAGDVISKFYIGAGF